MDYDGSLYTQCKCKFRLLDLKLNHDQALTSILQQWAQHDYCG